jgi:hypothetical protein
MTWRGSKTLACSEKMVFPQDAADRDRPGVGVFNAPKAPTASTGYQGANTNAPNPSKPENYLQYQTGRLVQMAQRQSAERMCAGSGIAATGRVAVTLDFQPAASPRPAPRPSVPSGGSPLWPGLVVLGALAGAIVTAAALESRTEARRGAGPPTQLAASVDVDSMIQQDGTLRTRPARLDTSRVTVR